MFQFAGPVPESGLYPQRRPHGRQLPFLRFHWFAPGFPELPRRSVSCRFRAAFDRFPRARRHTVSGLLPLSVPAAAGALDQVLFQVFPQLHADGRALLGSGLPLIPDRPPEQAGQQSCQHQQRQEQAALSALPAGSGALRPNRLPLRPGGGLLRLPGRGGRLPAGGRGQLHRLKPGLRRLRRAGPGRPLCGRPGRRRRGRGRFRLPGQRLRLRGRVTGRTGDGFAPLVRPRRRRWDGVPSAAGRRTLSHV